MAPSRKSRSVNKRFANEVSPNKLAENASKNKHKKRKLSNLLGPQWSKPELERFYHAYRKHGKDWKKVATAVRNRSAEMVEALYSMNKAYLSLPEGAASVVGLVAMMIDHYDVLGGSNSDQESSEDGGGSPPKKRAKGNRASKGSDEHFAESRSQPVALSDGYLSLLNKKRSENFPRVVRKRTPRVPFSYLDKDKEKSSSPAKQKLKLNMDADDDHVTHELAMALTKASQRSDSPKVSRMSNKKQESASPSQLQDDGKMRAGTQMTSSEIHYSSFEDGTRRLSLRMKEGDNIEYFRDSSYSMGRKKTGALDFQVKGKIREVKRQEVEHGARDHSDDVEEASNTTNERKLSAVERKTQTEIVDEKKTRKLPKGPQKRSRKSLFGDEGSPFDALQTLADMSLMMRSTADVTETCAESKEENADDASRCKLNEKHGVSVVEEPASELPKLGNAKASDHKSTIRVQKRKQKSPMKMQVYEKEAQADPHLSNNQKIETTDEAKRSFHKNQRSPHSSENLLEKSANALGFTYLGTNSKRKVNDSVMQTEVPIKEARTGWKMNIQKPITTEDTRSNERLDYRPNMPGPSDHMREHNLEERLDHCLSRRRARTWCTYEWFYSAIDYPWFARSEFVEYLQHVALDHIPRLTRVEWNVIKGSLGRPRRFSDKFLKEEREKIDEYRKSVRKHYAELRAGTREGLPTDLARPLSVGQHIIAIHPKNRELQNGTIIAVEHSRYRVKFDLPGLEEESVMDFECMPRILNDSIPASLRRHSLKELQTSTQLIERKADVPVGVSSNENQGFTKSHSMSPSMHDIDELLRCEEPPIETQIQTKEADIQAVSDLSRALDKKDAVVLELRYMNEALKNDKDVDNPLKDSESFKKQYAAVTLLLNEVNEQVSSALLSMRERNKYRRISPPPNKKPEAELNDHNNVRPSPVATHIYQDIGSRVDKIVETSRTKAQKVVDVALEAISSLEEMGEDWKSIEEAINFVNDRLSEEDFDALAVKNPASAKPSSQKLPVGVASSAGKIADPKSNHQSDQNGPKIPSELIAHCVATLIMIQKCTERQFPPSEVAQVLDSAVTDLQPLCSNNLSVYEEIQKYMGIIRTQILALIPS